MPMLMIEKKLFTAIWSTLFLPPDPTLFRKQHFHKHIPNKMTSHAQHTKCVARVPLCSLFTKWTAVDYRWSFNGASKRFKAIDNMLQDITDLQIPFGGKVFLMGGDFWQVLPVVPRAPPTVIVENCIKGSPCKLFNIMKLTKNMRAEQNQQVYAPWLLHLCNGQLKSELPASPPNSIDILSQCNITEDIGNAVFTDVTNPESLSSTVILATTNDTTLNLNNLIINKIPGQSRTYFSADLWQWKWSRQLFNRVS